MMWGRSRGKVAEGLQIAMTDGTSIRSYGSSSLGRSWISDVKMEQCCTECRRSRERCSC